MWLGPATQLQRCATLRCRLECSPSDETEPSPQKLECGQAAADEDSDADEDDAAVEEAKAAAEKAEAAAKAAAAALAAAKAAAEAAAAKAKEVARMHAAQLASDHRAQRSFLASMSHGARPSTSKPQALD